MAYKYLFLLFIILPNVNIYVGLPVLDFLIITLFVYNLLKTKTLIKEVGIFLLISFCFLIPLTFIFSDFSLDYLDFWGRYFLTMIVITLPKDWFSTENIKNWFFDVLFLILIGLGLFSLLQLFNGLISRREIEIIGFNDINIYLITLLLISLLGRYSFSKVLIVIIISAILGSRAVFFSALLSLIITNLRFSIFTLIIIFPILIYKNQDLILNLEILNRLNSGLENNEYSRISIWYIYLINSFDVCSYCSIKNSFSSIGLQIFRPAHNSILSSIGVLGLIPGIVFICFFLNKLKIVFRYKGIFILPFILFFDIQYSRSIVFLILILNYYYVHTRSIDPSIQ